MPSPCGNPLGSHASRIVAAIPMVTCCAAINEFTGDDVAAVYALGTATWNSPHPFCAPPSCEISPPSRHADRVITCSMTGRVLLLHCRCTRPASPHGWRAHQAPRLHHLGVRMRRNQQLSRVFGFPGGVALHRYPFIG